MARYKTKQVERILKIARSKYEREQEHLRLLKQQRVMMLARLAPQPTTEMLIFTTSMARQASYTDSLLKTIKRLDQEIVEALFCVRKSFASVEVLQQQCKDMRNEQQRKKDLIGS